MSVEDVFSLETKTEGWIAGLQLSAMSMQGREDISEFIQELKGDNRYIMDYLMEEVLKIQSDDIKEFILQDFHPGANVSSFVQCCFDQN